jgi:phosphoglucosamine mutase
LGDAGRIIVRYSGTENKIRLLAEAEKQDAVEWSLRQLTRAVEEEIGIIEEA